MYDDYFAVAHELSRAGKPFATATVVRAEKPTSGKVGDRAIITLDGQLFGWIGGSCAHDTVVREALAAIHADRSRLIRLAPDGSAEAFGSGITELPMTCFSGGTLDIYIEPQQPRPALLLVGALPVVEALAHLGRAMNYRVVAFDPDDTGRMAHADTVEGELEALPDHVTPLSFVVVGSHGHYDEEALALALTTEAPYVGLVASRKRGAKVLENVRALGVAADEISRVKVPAGLDIGARRGDEIALSIMAEVVQIRRGIERLGWHEPDGAGTTAPAEGRRAPDAAAGVDHGPRSSPAAAAEAVDPVCGMTVDPAGARASTDYQGRTYYFCCPGCRARFEADPGAFMTATA